MKDEPKNVCADLKRRLQTLQLATVDSQGQPQCGYTPFIEDGFNLVVFVSQLAAHTRNMLETGKVAVMLIADEQDSKQVFARCRVSYQCSASIIDTHDTCYERLLDAYQDRHGKMVSLLRQLPDFMLIRLHPNSGQFVMGFGQAYRLEGQNLDTFVHTRTG